MPQNRNFPPTPDSTRFSNQKAQESESEISKRKFEHPKEFKSWVGTGMRYMGDAKFSNRKI